MEEKIKSMDEFKQLTQSITKRNKNNINRLTEDCNEASQSAFWLEIFIRKLIYEKLEGELSEDLLTEYASLFKSEIESSPIEYRHVHHLDGIFLETDSIKINDSVRIRKTQKSDLEYTKNFPLDIIPRPQPMDIPSSILEIEILAKDERDCHKYVKRIFDSLRLYSLGSIYSQWSSSTKRTMIWPSSHTVGGDRNYSTFRKYTVKESEVDTLC